MSTPFPPYFKTNFLNDKKKLTRKMDTYLIAGMAHLPECLNQTDGSMKRVFTKRCLCMNTLTFAQHSPD
jgi:hypothetical protein